MVVDEEEEFREMVSALLEQQGYETYPAADGIDALRQIYQVMPRLIVADAELANLSGFEFLPFVRRRFPFMRVIGLEDEAPRGAKRFMPDAVLPKRPWNGEALLEAAEEVLSREMEPERQEVDCA